MEKLTPIQKLDKILLELADFKPHKVGGLMTTLRVVKHLPFNNEHEFNALLGKLGKDKYIEYSSWDETIHLTIEGSIFIGYEKQRFLENETIAKAEAIANQARSYARRLLWATWSAGIVAFFLLLWQVYSFYHPLPTGCPLTEKPKIEKNLALVPTHI